MAKGTKSEKETAVAKMGDAGTVIKAETFPIFGEKLGVAVERVEYTLLRRKFKALADIQIMAATETIDQAADNVDEFCANGNAWASEYIYKAADLAVEVLMEKKCFDIDRDTFINKFLDASLWNRAFKVLQDGVAAIDAEEAEREEGRQQRWNEAGNWVGLNEAGERRASEKNLNENLAQGAKNIAGRLIFSCINASGKRNLYKENREAMLQGIYLTIKTAVDELVDCLAENGHPLEGAKVDKEANEKAERLFNNLKTGKLPEDAAHDAKMEILRLDPYRRDFYEYIYVNEGDKTGELCATAEFFGISLENLKAEAFRKQLGDCPYATEEETIEYRKKAVQLAEEIRIDPVEKLKEIDAKLKEFDEKARTVDGKMFDTREEAALQRQLSEFEKQLDLSSEEAAIASKKSLADKAKELGIDGEWKMDRVDKALKRFDELARTTFGILLDTRDAAKAALGDRELFYKGIEATVRATGQDAFYTSGTMPEKKIANARSVFPIPVDEFVIALTDTTLFGSGKTGLAVTRWGLRWLNGGSKPTNVKAISWEDFANTPNPPTGADNCFTLTAGGLYANGGSNVEEGKMSDFLTALHGYCRVATFFVKKSAEELAAEEAEMPFLGRVDRLLRSITDSGFLVGDRIPDKKRVNATKSCQVDVDDKILALIDSTLLGSAATALVACEKGVYWHNKESVGKCFIPWGKMSDYKDTMSVSSDGRLLFSQGNGFKNGLVASLDLNKVKDVFLKIGELAAKN